MPVCQASAVRRCLAAWGWRVWLGRVPPGHWGNQDLFQKAVFLRLKDHLAAGPTCNVEFSADLSEWVTNTDSPMIPGNSNLPQYDAVYVPFPPTIETMFHFDERVAKSVRF